MKTFDGYKKQALTDVYALLAGGGHKPLSEFSMAHTHPYLPLNGGTMLGSIKFNSNSLPQKTLSYVCGIDAFADGGEMGWMRGSDFVAQYAPTKTGIGASGTWSISISGNAATATNADKVDGYHASSLWRSDGATWNPGANVSLNASANSQEWSFDIRRNGYTGCYWHVWDSSLNTMLKVNADNGKVYAPYNFVGNLEGNASSSSKWLTTRTFTIGNTSKNVDGSGNVSWSLSEIGAASSSHTHAYLPLSGGTMTLGEGLKFHADENYFGTNADARIISLLDGNGTTCDGGLIIDERCTNNGTTTITELLRIRDNEFKWKGLNILHSGNSNVSGGGSTWGSSITVNINGTSKTLTIPGNPNTDYRVTQSETTTANYRPLVIGYTNVSTAGSGMTGSVTNQVYLSNKFYVQPSTGNLYATNFVGALSGNASSATKLQTARTIWGQSFNGTANIDNTLRIRLTTGNYCEGIRIQTADGAWSTIILGATADSGTNTNAWSIHRKADNNFAISRNSSDGINGLVMTSVGMGLGTTAPTYRLDVRGDTKITGSIRDLAIGGGIYWNPYVESTTDNSDAASITVVKSGIAGGTTLVLSLMNDANDTILFKTSTAAKLYHNSYPILTTLNTYVSNNKGYINDAEITLVNNANYSGSTGKLTSLGDYTYNNLSTDIPTNAVSYKIITSGGTDLGDSQYNVLHIPWSSGDWGMYLLFGANNGRFGVKYKHSGIVREVLDSSNYTSYAIPNSASCNKNWSYSGQSGQPTWLWGSNDGANCYVWNPSNFSVNYANSAGNADTVDGYHATSGRTFTGNINWSDNWNDTWSDGTNKHPWYGFDHRYPNTGAYSTTISDYFGMTIKTALTLRLDFGTLLLNGTSIYSINVASATKLQTPRTIWGQSFDGTGNVNGTFYFTNGDATMKIYGVESTDSSYGNERVAIQTSFDGQDPLTSNYPSTYPTRSALLLQPRGGYIGIGTTSPSYKLHVVGDIYTTTGFKKNGSSDSYVLLGGGGHKLESSLNVANADTVDGYHANAFATSDHTHDGRYMRSYSSTNVAPASTHGYWSAMTTQSGITSDWWHIIHTDWSGAANWRSELALPTQGRNGIRYRSDSGSEWTFGSWVKLLDENNYTSYCATSSHNHDSVYSKLGHTHDDRYYTESEVNNLLSNKLNISNFNWTNLSGKLVAGNEFNIVNDGFNAGMWFNYLPINDRSKTASITGYHFGNGATGYTSIKASGFIKNGSSSSYVLLGDGGHKAISDFATSNHTHSYLPLSGGTMTGLIVGNNKGGSWISGRSNAAIYQYRTTTDDWHPVVGFKTKTGSWEFGSVGDDFATFSWGSDSNYNSGTNATTIVHLRTISGTIALTSDIPTKSSWNYDDRYYTRAESDNRFVNVTGDTMSGTLFALTIQGANNSNRLIYRHLDGQNCDGNYDLYLQYHQTSSVIYLNGSTYKIYNSGANYNGNAATATNADKLDGYHASSFALSGHTHNYDNIYSKLGHTHDDRYYTESEINTKLGAYLPLSGGTMTGVIKSTYASGSWIGGVTNAILKGEYTGYGAILSMPVKNGRVSLSSYPSSNNFIYFGYATTAQINAGTNSFNKQMYWDAANNNLHADVFTGALSGNASTATKWATARTLTIGNTGKTVNGSANVSWSLSEIGAATSGHTHTLSLASDTGTSSITLAHGGKYKLTAGGNSVIFTLPTSNSINPANYYWANIKVRASSSTSTAPQFGKVKINTSSSTYQLNVSGDSYVTNWCRAGKGLYLENSGIYFAYSDKSATTAEIDLLSNNEFCWGANSDTLYFNFKLASRNATTVTKYVWNAGSSSTYASHTTGDIILGNRNYLITRLGCASDWYNGRNNAMIRMTSASPCSAITSIKTRNGSWEMGNGLLINDYLHFSYISDSAFNNADYDYNPLLVYFDSSAGVHATRFYENSDIRYKKILRNLSINSNTIATLPLFDFEWIENNIIGTGTSALAVLLILPNLVSGTDRLTLDYGVLGTIAGVTACKELVTLKSELLQLKEKVKELEDKLRKYENI